jgi:hypothetical protein
MRVLCLILGHQWELSPRNHVRLIPPPSLRETGWEEKCRRCGKKQELKNQIQKGN